MHAIRLLHKTVANALPEVHKRRLEALFVGVESLLSGQKLWLSGLGRYVPGEAKEKHKIKRMDRLLGNAQLGRERLSFYRWLAHQLVGQTRQPCLIVDWSDIDTAKKLFLLRAAIPLGGRALTVYEEVHPRYNHRDDMERFLQRLAQVLPEGCQPVIVTDAGFRPRWFKAVEAMGWYYVGRVRNRDYARFPGSETWFPAKSRYQRATAKPKALGALWLPRATPMLTQAYVYRKHAKGRIRLTAKGQRRRNGPSLKHAKREREPWLLVSNLPTRRQMAKHVVALYRERMSIEEAFRDLKAHRHGFALRQNLGRDPERIANLLLIAALATLCAWLTGLIGIDNGLHRALQANTERRRRVLSVFFVGNRLLKRRLRITRAQMQQAFTQLRCAAASSTLQWA